MEDFTTSSMKRGAAMVNGERQDQYGRPEDSLAKIAAVWTGLLYDKLMPGAKVEAKDVPLLMVGLKLARETSQRKIDNIDDSYGYLAMYEDAISPGVIRRLK